jgi:hypothetical protein
MTRETTEMPSPCTRSLTIALSACLMVALALTGAPASAQAPFRISSTVRSRTPPAFLLDGRVVNESGRDAIDIWVTAEALSASGKVLATGITFVRSRIGNGDTAAFMAKVPYVEGAENFRVTVSSYRLGGDVQSP